MPETSSATGEALPKELETTEEKPVTPAMPTPPPFPTFERTPTLPQQLPGNGWESGRDSRAR